MKQITVDDNLRAKLKAAVGDNVDTDKLAVFKATALNTLPVRKRHPVYVNGVHKRSFLEQMLAALKQESLPLQVMHDGGELPQGRVFDGEIVDDGVNSSLHAYFWVDGSSDKGREYISLVNNGTIDQVSVAVLPKSAVSNKTGFDFLGPDATYEHIWSGKDNDGNVMGENGAYVEMSDLNAWFEMSLVGQGGIPGARIHSSGDMKLAASGLDVPPLTLTLAFADKEKNPMDLAELVNQLTDTKVTLSTTQATLSASEAKVVELTAQIATLEAEITKLKEAGDPVKLQEALNGLFSFSATLSGDATAKAPDDVEALVSGTKEQIQKLRPTPPSRTLDASNGTGDRGIPSTSNAFKRAK